MPDGRNHENSSAAAILITNQSAGKEVIRSLYSVSVLQKCCCSILLLIVARRRIRLTVYVHPDSPPGCHSIHEAFEKARRTHRTSIENYKDAHPWKRYMIWSINVNRTFSDSKNAVCGGPNLCIQCGLQLFVPDFALKRYVQGS